MFRDHMRLALAKSPKDELYAFDIPQGFNLNREASQNRLSVRSAMNYFRSA